MPFATLVVLLLAALLPGCTPFPEPTRAVAGAMPIELPYREARGGIVIVTARVNDTADVDFILDTGAPVTVLLDGARTAALALDTRAARPLGDPKNPGTPVGVIAPGYSVRLGALTLAGLSVVLIPEKTMPCRERFAEINFGGVLGADLFRGHVVEIDTVAKRVRIHDPAAWQPPRGATALPLAFARGHPFVDTTVTLGDGQRIDGRMNVDTGLNRPLTLVVGSHPAITLPIDGTPRKSCYVNGVRDERDGPAVKVALGGEVIDVPVPIYSDNPNAVDDARTNTIGVGLFKGRTLFVDYPGKRLVLSRSS